MVRCRIVGERSTTFCPRGPCGLRSPWSMSVASGGARTDPAVCSEPQIHRRLMKKFIMALALVTIAANPQARPFPSRQISLVVPFPPGGSTDVAARIMADRMRAPLGQPVIIENIGGAGGSIAVGRVARAAPDGYTIDIGQWDTHVGSIIYKLDYDLQKDFEPIGLLSINPQILVARKDLPADNLKDLVAWMKANPGKINFVNQNA